MIVIDLSTPRSLKWLVLAYVSGLMGLAACSKIDDSSTKEASASAYFDVTKALGTKTVDGHEIEKGTCPALAVPITKAMADKKLTIAEARDLHRQAEAISDSSTKIYARNAALATVGELPTAHEVDCSGASNLFDDE